MIYKDGQWVEDSAAGSPSLVFRNGQWVLETADPQGGAGAPPEMGWGDVASGVAGSLAKGVSASWSDELLAAPMAAVAHLKGDAAPGAKLYDTYSKMKDSLRSRQSRFDTRYPVTSTTAQIAGGMLPISKALQGGKLAKTAAVGGGYGAAQYAGGLGNFSDADLADAALQIGLGAAMPAAMQKTGDGVRAWLSKRSDKEINEVIDRLVEQTGATPDDLRVSAARMGPNEASLVDVTGDVGVAYGQGARSAGGIPAVNVMERNLSKTKQAKDRIRDVMTRISGKSEGQYFASMGELMANRKSNAARLYGEALGGGRVEATPRMLRIFENNPTVRDAWSDVQETYARNQIPLPDHPFLEGKWPNMKAIQELKWEMDSKLSTLKGSLDATGKKEYQRALRDYREFMSDINDRNPLFQKANATYAGDSAMINAQEMGYKRGLGSKDVEPQLREIKGLSRSERDAYLQGILSNAYGKMGASRSDLMGNANQLASENSYKVLSALLGREKAGKLLRQIKSERRYREVDTKLREGSQTELRKDAAEQMRTEADAVPLDIIKTPVVRAAEAAVKKLIPKMAPEDVVTIADIITRAGGVDDALNRLVTAGAPREVAEGLVGAVAKSSAAAAAPQMAEGE